jgi:hypothetical protein
LEIGIGMARQIIFSHDFDAAVERLGGYRSIDVALDTIMDGLEKNPYGFERFENDYVSFRYAMTKPIDDMPSLVVYFIINDEKDVILEDIEEAELY